jgi:FdrA protein
MRQLILQKNAYYDSVFLMQLSLELKDGANLLEAFVSMGTPTNREMLEKMGYSGEELDQARPEDLLIALEAEDGSRFEEARSLLHRLLAGKQTKVQTEAGYRPRSLEQGLRSIKDANLAIISVPGAYASHEAKRALEHGLHVMLFSDNVSLEEEITLKHMARERGSLMMGPDCGTAILNGAPICFANVVRRGSIGIVGASGTGIQEVSCAVHRMGAGISQAIGTGGRDLLPEVGGLMMISGIEALAADPQTKVLVLISKPPHPEVAEKMISLLEGVGKPGVVCFVGEEPENPRGRVRFAKTLTEAAALAVTAISEPANQGSRGIPQEEMESIARQEISLITMQQRYLRGLFSGGTLADEAIFLLESEIGPIHSNLHSGGPWRLNNPERSVEHTIIDLGDDYFTRGKPHPMIDFTSRNERILQEANDPQTAVVLLDVVLGYGSHPSPAEALRGTILRAKARVTERGGYLSVIASITGTDQDPQGFTRQVEILTSLGCRVMPSNSEAACLAGEVTRAVGEGMR